MACEHCAPTARELENLRQEMGAEFAATRQEIRAGFATLNRKADQMSEQQQDLDADVQTLTGVVGDVATQSTQVGTDLTAITAEIAALQQQVADGQPVDLTQLDSLAQAAVSTQQGLDTQVQALTAAVPSAPSGN